jgi:photosystem II stability/assembly factor-like uncharacterized protein
MMKPNLTVSLYLVLLLCACIQPAESSSEKNEREDEAQRAMHQEFLMTRDPALNTVPVERMIYSRAQMDELQAQAATAEHVFNEANIASLTWTERGPNNIGGRTRAILVDRNDATGNTVFAGSVGGGLWKTTNFKATTPTWTAVNDFFSNCAITCIKQDPNNASIMYFGTGEGWYNSDGIRGLGIWKSTDGGATWSNLSSTSSIYCVQDLEFDNNSYLYAATRSSSSSWQGILRSTDGGSTWTRVLTDATASYSGGTDLERGPNGDLYASLGIFNTGAVYRSPSNGTNTGVSGSWTTITPPGITTYGYQRTELAVCPNNSSRIYAMTQHSNDNIGAIYKSDDNGATWTKWTAPTSWCDGGTSTPDSDFTRGQAWYDLVLAVDPNNSSNVLAGGVVLEKSSDAGSTWAQASTWGGTCGTLPYVHADIHEIQYLSSTEIIVCCDGGIFYSSDGGSTFTSKNNSYNVTQYYSVALHPTSGSNYMLAGAQDNGSHKFSASGINTVTTATGGDGGFCFISQTNGNYQLTSFTGAAYNRSTNGGSSWATPINTSNGRFINPADLGPNDIFYFGYTDGAYGNYDLIGGGGANIISLASFATLTNLQVSAIKADPNTNNVAYMAFSTSDSYNGSVVPKLLKVTNANGTSTGNPAQKPSATEITLPTLAAGTYISSIDVETGNSSHMLLTMSNYGIASVYESTNGGASWTSLDNNGVNLPDMPIRWGVFVPSSYNLNGSGVGGIMLATELGVWTTTTTNGTSTTWVSNNSGLANVRSDMIKLRSSDKTIAVATHGRGLFTTIAPTILPITLLDFGGNTGDNAIHLNWHTTMELNSKNFDVEKSTDGVHFFDLGTVAAAGNSNTTKGYSFEDVQVNTINYYRLKMNDLDGHSRLSGVVVIKGNNATQKMWVTTNPFTSYIGLRFAKPVAKLKLELISMSGAVLFKNVYSNPAQQIQWNIPTLANGTYFIRAILDDEIIARKILRQ